MAVHQTIYLIISCIAAPLIAFFLGILFSYEIRKFSARMQSRRGPWFIVPVSLRALFGYSRIWQPLWDIIKLLFKDTAIPQNANRKLFTSAPIFALACLTIATLFIPVAGYSPFSQFEFSLVVVLYLLIAVPMAIIVGGSASSSPWGGIGSRREAELMLAYEIPLITSFFSAALLTGLPHSYSSDFLPVLPGSLSLADIVRFQNTYSIQIFGLRIPAFLIVLNPFAALAALFSIAGLLKLKPFDIPEAEVEIVAGCFTEYSGKLLGIWEIVKIFLLFISATLYVNLFIGGALIMSLPAGLLATASAILLFLAEAGIVIFFLTVIHTSNPRYRIDQGFKWYTKIPLTMAIFGLLWSYLIVYLTITY